MKSNTHRATRLATKRSNRRSAPRTQNSKLAVVGGPLPWINPDREFLINRRFIDTTCYFGAAATFNSTYPAGYSGNPPFVFGTAVPDTGPAGPAPYMVPMALSFSLTSLGQYQDLQAMFTEFQIRAVRLEVSFLAGDSYNPGAGSLLPEILAAVDPTDANTAITPQGIESYGDSIRQVLNQERNHVASLVPRPAISLYNSAVSSSYAYESSSKALWFSLLSAADMPFYGWKALIRNWCSINASGAVVRLSGTVQLALRRPH